MFCMLGQKLKLCQIVSYFCHFWLVHTSRKDIETFEESCVLHVGPEAKIVPNRFILLSFSPQF